jgi:uncharacterized protein (TIGR02996 family)
MTDRESFVAAIAANPQEDAPRLAFADWIEEQGDATRAGFIRDQVRLARMAPGSEEAKALFRRTAETLKANLPAWIQDACDAFGQPANWWPQRARGPALTLRVGHETQAGSVYVHPEGMPAIRFERGFLEAPEIIPYRLGNGKAVSRLLAAEPITRVHFRALKPEFASDWSVPELQRIRVLSLFGPLSDDSARALFLRSDWSALRRLTMEHTGTEAMAVLCSAPLAKRLGALAVDWNESGLTALARYPLDEQLQEFRLNPGGTTTRGDTTKILERLNALPFRPTLKKLDLAGCTIGDSGLAALARGEVWIRLKALVLDRNRFGDPGWRDFVRGRRTPELKALIANRNFLTRDGAVRLAQSPLVETLEWIDLRGNRIDGKGAVELARRLVESPLKKLLLAGNPIGERETATVRKMLGERVDVR